MDGELLRVVQYGVDYRFPHQPWQRAFFGSHDAAGQAVRAYIIQGAEAVVGGTRVIVCSSVQA